MREETPEGKYVYCISGGEARKHFGGIGVCGNHVYTISSQGMTAVVHDCQPTPYNSKDLAEAAKWLATHNKVIELAMNEFGATVPLRFNTIFKPAESTTSTQVLAQWMSEENNVLKEKLRRVAGKKEYGVQIYCGEEAFKGNAAALDDLKQKISASSPGTAYLYRQKLDYAVTKNIQDTTVSLSRKFHSTIKENVSEISVLKKRNDVEGKLMLANFACLADEAQAEKLGGELEKIHENGFEVQFTGPWPPYNFMGTK